MVKRTEIVSYVKDLADTRRAVDYDHAYNFQCFDLVQKVSHGYFGHWLTGNGAKDLVNSPIPSTWKRIKNIGSFKAEPGDIAIFTWGRWGHTAVIIDGDLNSDLTQFRVVEQNAKGTGLEPATYGNYHYADLWGVIRPYYDEYKVKKTVKSAVKKTVSKVVKSKGKKILLVAGHGIGYDTNGQMINDPGAIGNGTTERDFIRKNIVPKIQRYLLKAGHKVDLYGGSTMNQDLFRDSAYGQAVGNHKDYGMYWVARQKYDVVVEFHLDASGGSASGGHVIIGAGLAPDSIDRGIQNVITKNVGALHDIAGRDNLLNVNLAKHYGVNYRLVELGFITSKRDMDYIKGHLDQYAKGIAEAIHGKEIPSTISTQPKKKASVHAKASKVHTVVKGESLWSIAKKYKVEVKDIKIWNKLSTDTIKINQKLIVKK